MKLNTSFLTFDPKMAHLKSRPGFTLLELLISIAIFSGLMILALGAFARSANSAATSNLTREKSEAARAVIDQISNDFRYVTNDAAPYGCPADTRGFCLNPTAFASSGIPASVSMLLDYPGQGDNYVMKTYFVSSVNHTVMVIENRGCVLTNLGACEQLASNGRTLLSDNYLLQEPVAFDGKSRVAGAVETGYLQVNLLIRPKNTPNCDTLGPCYKLQTTLVPGGF